MPKKTTIPKTATDIQVSFFDEHYTSDGSNDDVCYLCLDEYQDSKVFEVSWHTPKRPIRLSIFVCPKCAKEIAAKYDTEGLADWFPEQPARTREVVQAELIKMHSEHQLELDRLYIQSVEITDKYRKNINALRDELCKIDEASQPEIAPCLICGSTNIEVQKFPASTNTFKSDQFFYQCENGHTGTRAMFGDKFEARKHWNEVMGGNNV